MQPLWRPSEARIAAANLTRFTQFVNERYAVGAGDYAALWQWSIAERERFWSAVWDFGQIKASERGERVLVDGDRMPGARWFPEARLNFAENLLRRRDDAEAIVFWNESGRQSSLTYAELFEQTAHVSAALKQWGVQPGDRIAALLPNIPEAIVVMLAAASLGAIFSSCSPDFGVAGAVDRFGQIAPRVLFVADGYLYGGKSFSSLDKATAIRAAVPSIETCVLIPYLDRNATPPASPGWTSWHDVVATPARELTFAQLPFDHPLYILYSSGTTGVPKCIVHGAGGTLLQHVKEHVLHTDLRRDDRLFYFTTTGWMMWNWLVSALASEATVVLFDGSPFAPTERVLWDLAEQERVTVFGTSAKYLAALEKAGASPRETHRLDSLRAVLSTGSPLLPESFDYVYREIKADVCLSSISGGTDIVSCFVLGVPTLPVVRGEIQARGLGMQVEVFNEHGRPVESEKGELVCTAAFPSMPVGFWNDPDGSRYRAAYFERYPGVWRHGDYTELTSHGGVIIYGRSDAVLNPGGVRIGTAEIYRQVEQVPEVVESLAVGQSWQGDVRIVLFVRLRDGVTLDDAIRRRIVQQVRSGASPRHVPAKILQVSDIPRTRSGKIVELAVADCIHGRPVHNVEALANPAALEQFRGLVELQSD
ncbi:MAG: acetoacetate--CoA ligase [Planctomycetaceae bacterium]|nr:acetoacetate--CoA ligase [Planctomycetaceae bacterium]